MKVATTKSFWSHDAFRPPSRQENLPKLLQSSLTIRPLSVTWKGWKTSHSPESMRRARIRTNSQAIRPSTFIQSRPQTEAGHMRTRSSQRRPYRGTTEANVLRKIKHLKSEVKKAFDELLQTKKDKFDKIVGQVVEEYGLEPDSGEVPDRQRMQRTAYLNIFNKEFEQEDQIESKKQGAFERWNLIY